MGQGLRLETRIEVPEKVKRFIRNPTPAITRTLRKADTTVLRFLQNEISKAAPRGRTSRLARSIEIDVKRRKVFSTSVYARAIELGHYAEARPGKFLRFLGTEQRTGVYVFPVGHFKGARGFEHLRGQFVSFVRTKKQPFFFLALARNRLNVIKIYNKAFKRLMEN